MSKKPIAYIGWHPDDGYLGYTINIDRHKCAESISYAVGFNPYVEKVEIRELVFLDEPIEKRSYETECSYCKKLMPEDSWCGEIICPNRPLPKK